MRWVVALLLLIAACSGARAPSPGLDAGTDSKQRSDASTFGDLAPQAVVDAQSKVDVLVDGTADAPIDASVVMDAETRLDVAGADLDGHGTDSGIEVDGPDAFVDAAGDASGAVDLGAVDSSGTVPWRDQVARAIEASSCPETCPMTTVTASPGRPRPSSRGQRILLIDDGIIFSAATRYANRTLAFLKADDDGWYREYAPSFQLPAEAYAILKKLDEASPPVRAIELDLAEPFAKKFWDRYPEAWIGHGTDIHDFLAEKIPDAQFVVSESKLDFKDRCALLDADTAADEWSRLEEHFSRTQQSLADSIAKHGVSFVHLSWGMEYDGVVRQFQHDCQDRAPDRQVVTRILEMYVRLFRAIAALTTPGADGSAQPVLLFQAAAPAASQDDFLVDCTDIPGRIRVMSASYDGSAVPRGGSYDYSFLSAAERTGMACTDVFMVMGYTSVLQTPRSPFFESLTQGLGPVHQPVWPPTPSFANPIALAHFLCIAQRYPEEDTTSWAARLTAAWTKPIVDPILYDELPVNAGACAPQ